MSTENKNRGIRSFWRTGVGVLGLVAAAGILPGCFVETSSPPPPAVCTTAPAMSATWFIDKSANGAQLTCFQAAGTTVRLTLDAGTAGELNFDFPCSNGAGVTTPLDPGRYNAQFTLFGGASGQEVLSTTGVMAVTVATCGVSDLGDVEFTVN